MNKGVIGYIILIVLVIVVGYYLTGFKFGAKSIKTTTATTTYANTTTALVTTINYSNTITPCGDFQIVSQLFNASYIAKCTGNGSTYGLWVASGDSGREKVRIVGADGKTYVNQNSTYKCITFYQNFTGPAQIYTINFTTGSGGGSCGNADAIINSTTLPPPVVYDYFYNGNFSDGQYTGWNVTDAGFGPAPLNITISGNANVMCYVGSKWSNYVGVYFATTYDCGLNVAPGNLTSPAFLANPATPFLNFRIISPADNGLYLELFEQNYKIVGTSRVSYLTPLSIIHINTYNQSISINSSSTFENVTIPLTSYINHDLRIRVVADSLSNYIAVGDFALARRPVEQRGVAINITTIGS